MPIEVTTWDARSWKHKREFGFEVWESPYGDIVRAPKGATPFLVVSYASDRRLPPTPFVLCKDSLSYTRARNRAARDAAETERRHSR